MESAVTVAASVDDPSNSNWNWPPVDPKVTEAVPTHSQMLPEVQKVCMLWVDPRFVLTEPVQRLLGVKSVVDWAESDQYRPPQNRNVAPAGRDIAKAMTGPAVFD